MQDHALFIIIQKHHSHPSTRQLGGTNSFTNAHETISAVIIAASASINSASTGGTKRFSQLRNEH
jgi:hypothetical protein